MSVSTLLLLLFFTLIQHASSVVDIKQMYENPLAHGFGEDIDWVKWDDAIEIALEKDKPIFLLIHKSWCHACKALKKTFQQSNARKAFKKLSEYFVMVNTEDDDEPYEEEYRPDGKYIPRLLFLDKNGDLLPQFKNKKAEYKTYGYYYASPADVLNSMKDVLKYYDIEIPELRKGGKLKPAKQAATKEKEEKEKEEAKTTEKKKEKETEEKEAGKEKKESDRKTAKTEEHKKTSKRTEKKDDEKEKKAKKSEL